MSEGRDDPEIFWVDPRKRGVMPLDGFHISRSLRRAMRRSDWTITTDRDFQGVLDGCADREDTWINSEIRALYTALHLRKQAHSLEVWEGDTLVIETLDDAGSILVDRLRSGDFVLFDMQFITGHLASLGGIEISRAQYHTLLAVAKSRSASFDTGPASSPQDVMQRMTQMS